MDPQLNQTDVLSKVHQSQVSFLRGKMRENMIEINDEDVQAHGDNGDPHDEDGDPYNEDGDPNDEDGKAPDAGR